MKIAGTEGVMIDIEKMGVEVSTPIIYGMVSSEWPGRWGGSLNIRPWTISYKEKEKNSTREIWLKKNWTVLKA